jgi:hypothetical protein
MGLPVHQLDREEERSAFPFDSHLASERLTRRVQSDGAIPRGTSLDSFRQSVG